MLEALVRWIVQALPISGERGTDIAPVGALRKVDDVVNVFVLPEVLDQAAFILRHEGPDLNAVGLGAVGGDEVHGVRRIQEWRKNLLTVLHQPRSDEEFVGMVLVKASVRVRQSSRSLRHGRSPGVRRPAAQAGAA